MTENKCFVRLVLASLIVGFAASSAQAALGLKELAASGDTPKEGMVSVGETVRDAVQSIYSSTDDPAEIERQLIEILNEAAASEDEGIVRYTIVAVMMGGGPKNLSQSKSAIDNSDVFSKYRELTAFTVAACESLISESKGRNGRDGDQGGGRGDDFGGGRGDDFGGGRGDQGGGRGDDFGGGFGEDPFDNGSDADIDDEEGDATPT
jgi:hypothetical protein